MSYSVSGNTIFLTRGDTLPLKVRVFIGDDEDSQEEYFPVQGDSLRFALKHKTLKSDKSDFTDEDPLILKDIPIDTMLLKLDPEDTKDLDFGSYVYDIEITFADGTVNTFITKAPFKLTEEVY